MCSWFKFKKKITSDTEKQKQKLKNEILDLQIKVILLERQIDKFKKIISKRNDNIVDKK